VHWGTGTQQWQDKYDGVCVKRKCVPVAVVVLQNLPSSNTHVKQGV